MFAVSRKCAFVLLAALALTATGCGSNNAGKIEGKWKFASLPNTGDVNAQKGMAMMEAMGLHMYFDFKPNGVLEFGLGSDKPEALKGFQMLAGGNSLTFNGKYKLLSGDGVELYDFPADMDGKAPFGGKDRGRGKIKITGDTMVMSDDKTSATLTRVK